jgi:hypothetical protein
MNDCLAGSARRDVLFPPRFRLTAGGGVSSAQRGKSGYCGAHDMFRIGSLKVWLSGSSKKGGDYGSTEEATNSTKRKADSAP